MRALILAAVLAAPAAVAAQEDAPPVRDLGRTAPLQAPPANLLPERVGGAVIYVRDLEAQRRWYETMLGFRVVNTYARDGQVFEYIMTTGDGQGAFVGLMASPNRPPGANSHSRIVLPVPDPRALANHFSGQGVYVREAVPGSAYFVLDPEGNQIEVYRLTAPAAE